MANLAPAGEGVGQRFGMADGIAMEGEPEGQVRRDVVRLGAPAERGRQDCVGLDAVGYAHAEVGGDGGGVASDEVLHPPMHDAAQKIGKM